MVSRRPTITSVPRSPLLLPSALLCLVLAACDGGVHGTPGGAGLRDPYFPKAGNGGYDVGHYGLTLAYDPDGGRLTGTAVVTARATKDLTAFDLDLKGLHGDRDARREAAAPDADEDRPHLGALLQDLQADGA
ncbi:hypothetical protein ACFV23_54655, partial [Streptomyces sp. NPDC059627]